MHTTTLREHDFELTVDDEPGTIETLFEGFDERDRLGIVITSDHGAAGAAALILATVTAFYDRLRATGDDFLAYPEYFALHVGGHHGSLRQLDIFPEDRELVVSADAEEIVGAVNANGITRLLIPSRVPRDPRLEPKTRARADEQIRTALVYSSRGRVLRPNVTVTGSERAEAFVTAMLVSTDADAGAHARRGGLRPPDGLPLESFRRIALPGALGMLGSIKG